MVVPSALANVRLMIQVDMKAFVNFREASGGQISVHRSRSTVKLYLRSSAAVPIRLTFFYVTIKHDCGDACHIVRQLYDGERHEFVHAQDPSRRSPTPLPEELGRDLEDLSVAPGSEGFVSRGVLYH